MAVEDAEPHLCAIDFENTSVGLAEFELGYAFAVDKALLNSAANKRFVVKGYIEDSKCSILKYCVFTMLVAAA